MKEDKLINTIIAADTTKVLPELIKADRQYDVIIADPPYNIGKDFGNDTEVMPIDVNGTNGKVLVPFSGSGSECVVAQTLGVEFLGIEINPEFADFAMKWLEHESKNHVTLQLFEHTMEKCDR